MRFAVIQPAHTFGQYVATNPEEFSAQATALIGCPAIFIRRFIEQMHDAITKEQNASITPVLDIGDHVIDQSTDDRAAPAQDNEGQLDREWQWTRDTISRLLKGICSARSDRTPTFPVELRGRLWRMIDALCRDPASSYIRAICGD